MSKKITGVKGEFTEQDLELYFSTVFAEDVILFNKACGKDMKKTESAVEGFQMIVDEAKRVFEEALECFVAYSDKDDKERLDGLVDVIWCYTQINSLLTEFTEVYGTATPDVVSCFDFDEDLIVVQNLAAIYTLAETLARSNRFTPKRIMLAAQLIAENNSQKYTEVKSVADDWINNVAVSGIELESNVVDSVTYYCLKRKEDNKVMKPYNFVPVKLEVY